MCILKKKDSNRIARMHLLEWRGCSKKLQNSSFCFCCINSWKAFAWCSTCIKWKWILIGCFGFSGPLRQYFSLYQAVSQREGERGEKGQRRVKISKQPPPAPTASAIGPCPTISQIVGRPGTGSNTQDHRTTRPPPMKVWLLRYNDFVYNFVTVTLL